MRTPDFPPLFLKQLHVRQGEMIRGSIRPALDAARRARPSHRLHREQVAPLGVAPFRVRPAGQAHQNRATPADLNSVYVNDDYNRYSAVIEPKQGDFVVQKTMYDSFFETTLDTVLRNLDIKNLVSVGFSAEICLLNTLIGALNRNYRVYVLRDCVWDPSSPTRWRTCSMTRWAVRYYEALVRSPPPRSTS